MYRGKILAIMDSATGTSGYSDQAEVLLTRFVSRGWDVYQIACNCFDLEKVAELKDDGFYHFKGIKLIKNIELEKNYEMIYPSKERVLEIYNQIQPDIIFTLNDLYRVAGFTDDDVPQSFKDSWVHWFPIDTPNGHIEWGHILKKMPNLIMLSRFGYRDVYGIVKNNRLIDAIYHAVPDIEFFPMEKDKVKKANELDGKFVITTLGRNQPRKMIYVTAEAVCKFLSTHPDAYWLCKSDPKDASMHEFPKEMQLDYIVSKYHVENQVDFIVDKLNSQELNEFYNCGDVFIHLSGGEGFGIGYVESMLAGVPCILSDNTTSPELTGNWKFGFAVPIANGEFVPRFNAMYGIADVDEAVSTLDSLHYDWKHDNSKILKDCGTRAREFHQKWCNAEYIADKWEEIFQKMIRFNTKFVWYGHFGRGVGFSSISEMLVPELEKMGYDAYAGDWCNGTSPILPPHMKELYIKYLTNPNNVDYSKVPQIVCDLMETYEQINGNCKIGWSFLESTKQRKQCVDMCNKMDYIITSSDFCKRIQEESGVKAPTWVISPCYDQKKFYYVDRSNHPKKPFTFLHVGVVQIRKNTKQLVDGYVKAFPDNGETRLILKSNDFGLFDMFKQDYGDRKDIEYIYTNEKPLTQEELMSIYARADCYVNLSHGEGIGMPDLEAMGTGLPVIGANWDTRQLFLSDEVGWMIPIAFYDNAYPGIGEYAGLWAHYEGNDYIDVLRKVAANPELAREKGKKAYEVAKQFTIERTAKEIDNMILTVSKAEPIDKRIDIYDENYYTNIHKYTPAWHDALAEELVAMCDGMKGKVLDCGCGRGYIMKHLLQRGVDVVGCDYSEWAVRNPMPECAGRIKHGNVLHLGYKDNQFDWVVAFSLVEHLTEDVLDQALQELRRVGKKFLIQTSVVFNEEMEKHEFESDPTHHIIRDNGYWEEKFKKNGLKLLHWDGWTRFILEKIPLIQPITGEKRLLVGIPTKDRAKSLIRTLHSLADQTFAYFDVFVVDDSKKDMLPAIKELHDVNQILWERGHNIGFERGAGINQAVAHTKIMNYAIEMGYELVYRLDDDVVLEPDNIERLMEAFYNDKECKVAAVGGLIINPATPKYNQKITSDWRTNPDYAGTMNPCVSHAQNRIYPDDVKLRDDIQHLYSSYIYRPALLKSVGGFPSGLSQVASREETIPVYELYLRGYKMNIVTQAISYHFHEDSGGCRERPFNECQHLYLADEVKFIDIVNQLNLLYSGL